MEANTSRKKTKETLAIPLNQTQPQTQPHDTLEQSLLRLVKNGLVSVTLEFKPNNTVTEIIDEFLPTGSPEPTKPNQPTQPLTHKTGASPSEWQDLDSMLFPEDREG